MNFRRSDGVERPADRAEAERLLDAARSADMPPAGDEPLARLLSAAAAPARPGELAGEEAALAAFRAARAAGASAPAPAPPSRRRRRVTTGVVAWVAGIAATATAGAAFAAVTLDRGDEPAPAPRPPTSVPGGSGSDPAAPSSSGGGPTTGAPGAGPSAASPEPGASGKPASEGRLAGQCRAYLAKPAAQREKALRSPTFADLVAAAGGAGKVEAYCRELLPEQAPEADESPTAKPSRSPAAPAVPTPDARPSRNN
ncbi:hypothetical protein GA0074696_3151 [Micromonospora purpureochromogenes]|uniref:Uncharacterized protein n=1 Tax=Micromonospora purpureochromogenes TaxID=47872 RepID=A0A1C4Y981_9ACTN|nr:hypothetical protein [Micromonospora purpureochromogenes]SCF17297.1 hypothetical protein GA0074696_3151 [Micromonospora purpureochromogenes]